MNPLFLVLWMITMIGVVCPKEVHSQNRLVGSWEGNFMNDNNLTLILNFQEQSNKDIGGNIRLFQGVTKIQDDSLSRIQLSGNQLSFLIEAKNTPFEGQLTDDGSKLAGEFRFPDGSVHPMVVQKVTRPSRGRLSAEASHEPDSIILHQKFSQDRLIADLEFLWRLLEKNHPQLYLYTSKEDFEVLFDSLLHQLPAEATLDVFFRMMAPLVARIGCSHTGIRPPEAYTRAMEQRKHLIPLKVHFLDDQAYILKNGLQTTDIQPGTRLLSINGEDMSSIHRRLTECIPADALNLFAKSYEINHNFASVYSLYIGTSDAFDVGCIDPDGKPINVQIGGMRPDLFAAFSEKAVSGSPVSDTLPLSYTLDENSRTAVLKVKAFMAGNWQSYNQYLLDFFTRLRKEDFRKLIIDVRGNKGGHPFFAAELLTYLSPAGFPYFALPLEQGEFAPLYHSFPPRNEYFRGNLYVLMDGGCLSTTGHFLSLIRYHRLGWLVGEPSGSSFYANDQSIQVSLPETGIMLNLPRTTFQTAVEGFKMGDLLLPDYAVKPSLEDLLQQRDVQLEYTMKLPIRSNLNQTENNE